MPVPSPRNKILPARGDYADLLANVAELGDGEICYAIDQDTIYMKEGTSLVSTGGSSYTDPLTTDGDVVIRSGGTTTRLAIGSQGQVLSVSAGGVPEWAAAYTAGVDSVNGLQGNVTLDLGTIDGVTISAPTAGHTLRWNGGSWLNAQLSYSDLSNTPTLATVATSGSYNDLSDKPTIPAAAPVDSVNGQTGAVVINLDDVNDVTLTTPTNGDVLSYNGTNWINSSAPPADISGSSVGQLNDVTITAAATGEVLRYNGSNWVDAQLAYSDLSGTPTLATVATSGSYNDLADQPTIPAAAPVDSVNSQTGAVVLDADDISDASTTNKFATSAELTKLAGIAAGAEVNTVDSVNSQTGAVVLDADDIDDTSTTHKFATAAQLSAADSALQSADIGVTVQGYDADTMKLDVHQVLTRSLAYNEALGNTSINLQVANCWRITSSITVPTPTNGVRGISGVFRITSGTLVWPSVFKFPGGSAPTITSYPAIIPYYVQDSTNILMGNVTEGIS